VVRPAELVESPRIVAVTVPCDVNRLLHVAGRAPSLARGARGRKASRRFLASPVRVAEKECFARNDRTANAEPELLIAKRSDRRIVRVAIRWRGQPWNASDEILIAAEVVGRAGHRVRTALSDGVDAAARKTALPDVVRRYDKLNFIDRVEAHR